MPRMVFLLTHDFKPAFRRTIKSLEAHKSGEYETAVLMDDRSTTPIDLSLSGLRVIPCRRRPTSFDPIGQAHNFYLDLIRSDRSMLEVYSHFWVFENDSYFHGNIVEFMRAHDRFNSDLMVPEFGLRDPSWCWLSSAKGIKTTPRGVTAVAFRASSRLIKSLLDSVDQGVEAHMEVLLPHLCMNLGYTIDQFIPDMVGVCNTFGNPIMGLIEKDIESGSGTYVQSKLYHPVKS